MKFILNRNLVVASTTGRSVEFVKNEPTYVPPQMHKEVIAVGAIPEDEIEVDESKPVALTPEERLQLVKIAVEEMVAANNREDFTAAGVPNTRSLSTRVGFAVDVRERDAVWADLKKVA